MQTLLATLRRSAGLICASAILAAPTLRAGSDTSGQADAFPDFESYIKISGQTPWITGDTAAFATRNSMPSSGAAGIEDLLYTRDLNDTTTLTINGHALAGSDDYLADFKVETDKIGSIDAGYSRFRTFYDGIGGFFPMSDTFYSWDPQELHVDRAKAWIDMKLALPNRPVFTFSYHNEARTGMKDSTIWAPVINPTAVVNSKGALVGTAVPTNTPEIGPSVMLLDEHHNIFDAGMVAEIGNTTETLKATVDTVNNDDSRDYVKYPNSNVLADPTVTVTDDEETRKSTSFRLINQTESKLNERWSIDTGLSYMHESSTDGGSWLTPTYSSTANAVYVADTAADIYGISKVDDYVGNISFDYTPTKDWLFKLGYRQEVNVTASDGGFTTTSLSSTAKTIAITNITTAEDQTYSNFTERAATPEFEANFSGIKDLDLYFSIDERVDHDNQHWINPYAAVSTSGTGVITNAGAPIGSVFFQEADQTNDYAKLGANWNLSRYFTIRAEVFHKEDENQFVGADALVGTGSYGGLYATGYSLTGAKLTVTFRPAPTISFVTRYQPQSGTMSVLANVVNGGTGYNEITSGKVSGEMLSETANWTPNQQVYVQANANVVYNQMQTAYPIVVVSTSTYIPPPIQNANNNYVTGSVVCGFVLDKTDDLQIRGTYCRADDYNPQIAAGGEPYGAGFLEENVTAGVKHKFNDKLLGELKAGYLRRTDDTTGSFTNYRGPLVYVSLTYAL
jgi:hypothetical protein